MTIAALCRGLRRIFVAVAVVILLIAYAALLRIVTGEV